MKSTTQKSKEEKMYSLQFRKEIIDLLADYRSSLEKINQRPVGLDETIELLFSEIAGLEHMLTRERIVATRTALTA